MTKEQIRGKIQNASDVEALEYLWELYDYKVREEIAGTCTPLVPNITTGNDWWRDAVKYDATCKE